MLTVFVRREYKDLCEEIRRVIEKSANRCVEVDVVNNLEELKSRLEKLQAEEVFLLFFVGPNVLSELKKLCRDVKSLDELVMHVTGTFTNERIVILTTSSDDERVLLEFKAMYEVTPRQLDILKVTNRDLRFLMNELKRLITLGYSKALLGSPDLLLSSSEVEELFLEVVGVKGGFSFINALEVLGEVFSVRGEGSKPSSFEIKRILPCIADSTKIRVIAQLDASIGKVLPYLYLHFKNSKYLESLGVLTFLTNRGEMVSLYSSGKVCIVKVDSEHRAEEMLRELLMLISKAYEAYVRLGPVREDTLEARRRLNVMSIYWLLPKTNCRACGEPGCMAFAFKLLSGETQISKCKPLLEEPKFKDAYEKLKAMMSSPIGW